VPVSRNSVATPPALSPHFAARIHASTRPRIHKREEMMSAPDVNSLLDDLYTNVDLQRDWELNPTEVAKRYALTEQQLKMLLEGDVEGLIRNGIAERHIQQMRVSW
jgi:hypothetical protein